jgi:parvulin-like peptidyl-prolyl isomerase
MTTRFLTVCLALTFVFSLGCKGGDAEKKDPSANKSDDNAKNDENKVNKKVEPATEADKKYSVASKSNLTNTAKKSAVKAVKTGSRTGTQGTQKPPTKEAPRISGPVAVVNGQSIDSVDFYAKVDAVLKHNSRLPPERRNRVKASFLRKMIDDELIRQAVQKGGITVPIEEIEAEFAKYKKRFKSDEQFQNYLKRAKITSQDIMKRIESKRLVWKLLEQKGQLTVTDAEAEAFYKRNQRFYEQRETVKARHILVKVSQTASKDADAKAKGKIRQAKAALKAGGKFEDVARKFSEGPSASRGGMLPPFGRNQMVKPFEAKAFAMKKNEISDPIRTRHGYHIIQKLDHTEKRVKPFSEVSKGILESLRNKKFFTARRALVNGLRNEAKIEKKIAIPVQKPRNPHARRPLGHPPIPGRGLHRKTMGPRGATRPDPRIKRSPMVAPIRPSSPISVSPRRPAPKAAAPKAAPATATPKAKAAPKAAAPKAAAPKAAAPKAAPKKVAPKAL